MRAAVAGLGLMGASLAMALKRLPNNIHVTGIENHTDSADSALKLGIADEVFASPGTFLEDTDIAFVSVPVQHIPDMIKKMAGFMGEKSIITDMGSTKGEILSEVPLKPVGDEGPVFIGGHPMTGSERSGILNADPLLYDNAVWMIVTEENDHDDRLCSAIEILRKIVNSVGAKPVLIKPDRHDEIVAAISHMPHLAASILSVVPARAGDEGMMAFSGAGFRDTTRVASGNPDLWTEIMLSNRQQILKISGMFCDEMQKFRSALERKEKTAIRTILNEGRENRRNLRTAVKGLLPAQHEVTVRAANRPGIIAEVTRELGMKGVNIIDIEVLTVREGEWGALRLGFDSEEQMEAAIEALGSIGYVADKRN